MSPSELVRPPSSFPGEALALLKACLTNRQTRLRTDARVVFVCGGRRNSDDGCARRRLMEYAKVHLQEYSFFEAEDVFEALSQGRNTDLLSLEHKFADYSDCIIVITESAGSIAELGAFAMEKTVAKKVLAVNDMKYLGEESFIALGPIRKLDKCSLFKPAVHTDFERILLVAPDIADRLRKIPNRYRKKVVLDSAEALANCKKKQRLLFLADIIAVLSPLSLKELIECLQYFYDNWAVDIGIEIGLLQALGLITRPNGFLLRASGQYKLFYDYERLNLVKVRSQIVRHFHKWAPPRTAILTARSAGEF